MFQNVRLNEVLLSLLRRFINKRQNRLHSYVHMFVFARELLRIRFCLFHRCIHGSLVRPCVCVRLCATNRARLREYKRCHNTENTHRFLPPSKFREIEMRR